MARYRAALSIPCRSSYPRINSGRAIPAQLKVKQREYAEGRAICTGTIGTANLIPLSKVHGEHGSLPISVRVINQCHMVSPNVDGSTTAEQLITFPLSIVRSNRDVLTFPPTRERQRERERRVLVVAGETPLITLSYRSSIGETSAQSIDCSREVLRQPSDRDA